MIEESEQLFYSIVLPSCEIVFDVGCQNDNIFDDLKPGVEVHMFDPVSTPHLRQGSRFNNFALGNFVGTTDIHHKYGSVLLRDNEPRFEGMHQTRTVKVNTLYNYCKSNNVSHIDLLKIDTEGYDFEVIKGCRDFLNSVRYIEFEEWDGPYFGGETLQDIFAFFKGYTAYKLEGSNTNYVVVKEDGRFEEGTNKESDSQRLSAHFGHWNL
jgi:FkbM family methyltransferase